MSNHKQHIPTLDEIQAYLSGKAGFDLQYKVEKAMEDSPAVKEMVEGIEKNRNVSSSYDEVLQKKDLNQLQRNFNQKTGYQAGFKSYNIWIIASGVIVISVLTVLYINLVDFSKNNKNEVKVENTSNSLTKEEKSDANTNHSEITSDLDIEKDIQATNVSKDQKERTETSTDFKEGEIKESVNIEKEVDNSEKESFDDQLVPLQKLTPNALTIPQNKRPVKINSKVAYYHELKMMSYRDIYKSDQSEMQLSGLPADLKNEDDSNEDLLRKDHIPYEKYISEGLRLFKLEKYQEFLDYIKPVMQKYPDDQNALFYGGMSELNLGNYDEASQLLKKVAYSQYDAFHEEGNWYYALSLFKSGQKSKANKVLKSIIAEEGFYSERAQKLLGE